MDMFNDMQGIAKDRQNNSYLSKPLQSTEKPLATELLPGARRVGGHCLRAFHFDLKVHNGILYP